ncbi:hypothetical protein O3P69_009275 [Scylla paramamosain]|uniref:Uncharacterized protein n=1 Tax=Scylla paramamosain TaxID=85552 RepID=A0AAW0TC87_SCYPA
MEQREASRRGEGGGDGRASSRGTTFIAAPVTEVVTTCRIPGIKESTVCKQDRAACRLCRSGEDKRRGGGGLLRTCLARCHRVGRLWITKTQQNNTAPDVLDS